MIRKLVATLVALLALICGWAESQPPPPANRT